MPWTLLMRLSATARVKCFFCLWWYYIMANYICSATAKEKSYWNCSFSRRHDDTTSQRWKSLPMAVFLHCCLIYLHFQKMANKMALVINSLLQRAEKYQNDTTASRWLTFVSLSLQADVFYLTTLLGWLMVKLLSISTNANRLFS